MVSRKTLKKKDIENVKPLYTNISPAVAELFLLVIKSPATAGLFD